MFHIIRFCFLSVFCAAVLTACGGIGSGSLGNSAGSLGGSTGSVGSAGGATSNEASAENTTPRGLRPTNDGSVRPDQEDRETIWDLFNNRQDPNTDYRVNRYLWNASLDVLSFLPVEAADPFSGMITFGYGRAPGSSQAYRATVRITEAALDARALNVAVQTRNGPASVETQRQIENAILTRARQLRISDRNR